MVRFARTGIIKRRAAAPLVEGEQELISRFPLRTRRQAFVATMLAAAIVLAVPSGARSQHVVAFVNGQPITILDVEHRSKFILLSTKKLPTRKEVLDSLIDEILEVTEAKRYSVEVPDLEVEKSYAAVATRMGVDAPRLTQILASGGASADTLKRRLRAQVAWTNLVRGRFRASLEIRDKDVEAQLELHKSAEKDDVGYEYIMRPVVLIVPRGSPAGHSCYVNWILKCIQNPFRLI